MSALDELKNDGGVVIDMTKPQEEQAIATPPQDQAPEPQGRHKVIPNYTGSAGAERKEFNPVDIKGAYPTEQEGPGIAEHIAKDILEGEDSPFAEFVREQTAEMEARMEEYDDEIRLLKEEGKIIEDEDGNLIDVEEQQKEEDERDKIYEIDDIEKIAPETTSDDNISREIVDDISFDDDEDMDNELLEDLDEEDSVLEDLEEESAEDESPTEHTPVEEEEEVESEVPQPVSIQEKKVEEAPKKKQITNEDISLDNSKEISANIDLNVDIDAEEDNALEEEEEVDDLATERIRKQAIEKLKPVSQSLDISSFTVIQKPTGNVSKLIDQPTLKVAKWVVPNQKSMILMRQFLGSELEYLREYTENSRSFQDGLRRFRIIYDHIDSPKPKSFKTWLKVTPMNDIDHYYFAIYIASFKGTNYLPVDCKNPECKYSYLSDDINIMDMVKFETEDFKKEFKSIYQDEVIATGDSYYTERVPISRNIAIDFKEVSIYDMLQFNSLDENFKSKHLSIIDYIPYIDNVYIIDHENHNLVKVTYKAYEDNEVKTLKSRISKYDSVLKTLNVDEFRSIVTYVQHIAGRDENMHYVYPEVNCPKCGTPSGEVAASAQELVFIRYQLGALANTTVK